jgi:hypothetical protein
VIVLGPIGFGVDFAIRRRRSSGAAISARASPTTSRRWSRTASHATAFAVRSSLGPRPSNRKVNEAAGLAERDASTPSGDAVANGTLNGRSSGVGITLRRLERFGFAPSDLVQRPRRRKRALRDARSRPTLISSSRSALSNVKGAPGLPQIARRAPSTRPDRRSGLSRWRRGSCRARPGAASSPEYGGPRVRISLPPAVSPVRT